MYALYFRNGKRWELRVVCVEEEYRTIEYGYRWDHEYQIRKFR